MTDQEVCPEDSLEYFSRFPRYARATSVYAYAYAIWKPALRETHVTPTVGLRNTLFIILLVSFISRVQSTSDAIERP